MPWTLNPQATPPSSCPSRVHRVIGPADHRAAFVEIASWPDYRATPLLAAHDLARQSRLGSVEVKDESDRFGLGSFKALGGAYGVRCACASAIGPRGSSGGRGRGAAGHQGSASVAHAFDAAARRAAGHQTDDRHTVTCASDGNHGRSVAWGARIFGLDAVIYLPAHVTEGRAAAIRSLGARVVRVDGEYDDAVALSARDARAHGWTVISDTSWPGYMEIPRLVMAGYTVMAEEALVAMRGRPTAPGADPGKERDPVRRDWRPTHVFLQGGVGGLAAAVIAHLWERLGAERPVAVIVEPESADGLLESARAGEPRRARGDLHTIMAGLSCREISPLAWEVVAIGAHAFMTVPEGRIAPLMRAAARGELGDSFEGGEAGVAGLGGLVEAAGDPELRRALGLDERSRVLVFNTEGATDPELYRRIVAEPGGE